MVRILQRATGEAMRPPQAVHLGAAATEVREVNNPPLSDRHVSADRCRGKHYIRSIPTRTMCGPSLTSAKKALRHLAERSPRYIFLRFGRSIRRLASSHWQKARTRFEPHPGPSSGRQPMRIHRIYR